MSNLKQTVGFLQKAPLFQSLNNRQLEHLARHMVERQQGGSINNISTNASRQEPRNTGAYSESKAGLNILSRLMAMELSQHRIRVNALLPRLIET